MLLNHAEKRVTLGHITGSIRRADEVGLFTMACADSVEKATVIAQLRPNVILAEPSELIGGTRSVAQVQREFISRTIHAIRSVDLRILVLNSAGIRN